MRMFRQTDRQTDRQTAERTVVRRLTFASLKIDNNPVSAGLQGADFYIESNGSEQHIGNLITMINSVNKDRLVPAF